MLEIMELNQNIQSHFLVIGGGIAGLMFALKASKLGKVNLILKDKIELSSSQWAQGGINAVMAEEDSFEAHIQDTLDCGYGLCHENIVEMVVKEAPQAIEELMHYGVSFTKNGDMFSLHREGGHQFNRVVHAKDATGAAIMKALINQVQQNEHIQIFQHYMAIDLIMQHPCGSKSITSESRAMGAYVLDTTTNQVYSFLATITYLATGGIGKVYPYTSNPKTATGDGIAMAYHAGIPVVNLEFIQFHPTLLYHHEMQSFLISEAIRGEGGLLKNHKGEPFMQKYHPEQADLAPRDIVARAIDSEIKSSGKDFVFLDTTHLSKQTILDHFPTIYKTLLEQGLDITQKPIPVVPAAHYLCGGLRVNKWGQTSCKGLFAGGECTFTGFHGANRLASNSLLEAVVYAKKSVEWIENNCLELLKSNDFPQIATWKYHNYSNTDEESLVYPLWKEMRQFMWTYVGIIRTNKRLERALNRIQFLRKEIDNSYWNFRIQKDLIELRNISIVAELIIRSCISRKESRGLHYNSDHPTSHPFFEKDTIITLEKDGLFR